MSMTLSPDGVASAIVRELPGACTAVLGGPASVSDHKVAGGPGWLVTVPYSGAATGRIQVWLDSASATACATRVMDGVADLADDAVARVLSNLLSHLCGVVESSTEGAGLIAGQPALRKAAPPEAGEAVAIGLDDGLTLGFRVLVDMAAAPNEPIVHPLSDSRLEAVLEVDLPLVVRFGRAVMPLRAVADLSPGAVVDMGRTPDEPVELLVGERLVARGEVVIVGGNYGVRITELTSGRRASDVEARA